VGGSGTAYVVQIRAKEFFFKKGKIPKNEIINYTGNVEPEPEPQEPQLYA
jgi:hypothetical protein